MEKSCSFGIIACFSGCGDCSSNGTRKKQEKQDNLPGLSIGSKAPDFELKTLSGENVKLSDYRGKKVMLNFWATWCAPCKEEMPDMEEFYKQNGEEIEILAVNIDPQFNVQQFVTEMELLFRFYWMKKMK